ncbi:MAG: VOC family protein [Pseudomonadota bacterium]
MPGIPGPIIQSGFVVEDLEAAVAHWASIGVGPFFAMRHVEFETCLYRGKPTDADLTVAIAYSGDHQIELVQQHNDAPSIYSDWLATRRPGLQHMGTLVDDLDAVLDANGWRGKRVQHGRTAAGQRFAYLDTVFHDGGMIELIEADAAMLGAFAGMKAAAAKWDGSRALRG